VFADPREFPFTRVLEASWQTLREEYQGVRERLVDWHETKLYEGGGWKVFPIFAFPHGDALEAPARACPHTAALVREHVPRHGVAGFSVLLPRTRLRPHEGYQGEFLRCHLGLVVPPGDAGLRVGGELRRWQEGKALVFDDRLPHEAWNETDAERVVLLVDFVPPG
jgi:beta-hydroxylase